MMNDLNLFSHSPSLNLTNHEHGPPIYSSTPLVIAEKPPCSSTSSSFFLPVTENTLISENLVKLNEVSLYNNTLALFFISILGSLFARFI